MKDEKAVERVWGGVWESQRSVTVEEVFRHVLFAEGYRTIKRYVPSAPRNILEAGGGTGRYGIQLAADNPNARVTVIDIVSESLELGRRVARDRGVSNVSIQQDDLESLSFENGSFDLIVSDAVIQVFQNYSQAVGEMARVLQPGGTLIIAVCNRWNFHTLYKLMLRFLGKRYKYGYEKSFTHTELREAVQRVGLEVVAEEGFLISYGFSRHRSILLRVMGRITDVAAKVLDPLSGRAFSRWFGFEIVVIAQKAAANS